MKPDELSEAMKNVKDDYLQEADEIRKQGGPSREGFSPLFRGLMTAAAVLILAGGLTAAVLHIRNNQSGESGKTQVTSVSESRDETDTASDTEKTADPENTTSPEKTTAPERTTAPDGSSSGDQTDEQETKESDRAAHEETEKGEVPEVIIQDEAECGLDRWQIEALKKYINGLMLVEESEEARLDKIPEAPEIQDTWNWVRKGDGNIIISDIFFDSDQLVYIGVVQPYMNTAERSFSVERNHLVKLQKTGYNDWTVAEDCPINNVYGGPQEETDRAAAFLREVLKKYREKDPFSEADIAAAEAEAVYRVGHLSGYPAFSEEETTAFEAMLKASYNGTVQEVILPYFLLTDSAVFMTDCGDKMPWDSMMLLWVSPETEGDPEKEALKKKILGDTTDGYYVIVSLDTDAEASVMGSSLVIQNNLYQTPPEEILASYGKQAFVSDYETLIRFCMDHPETLLTARYSLGLDESKTEVLERYSPDGLTNLQFYLMWLLKLSGEFEVLDPEEITGTDEGKATVLYVEESAAGNLGTLSEQVNGASLTVFEGQNIFRLSFDRKVYYACMGADYDTASYMPEAEAYLRNLYDDAAYQAAVEKVKLDEMLYPVPQPGKTFIDAAKDHLAIEPAACELLDKDNCHVTEYYAFSVVPVDPATEEELAEIPADADSGYFRADIIWKAGNERSLRFHMAGSHMPYKEAMALQGLSPDPEVPEDAYIGSVFGKAEKSDEGWIVTMLGTAVR